MFQRLIITITDLCAIGLVTLLCLACLFLLSVPITQSDYLVYLQTLSSDWISMIFLLSCIGYYIFCAFVLKASLGRILFRKLS